MSSPPDKDAIRFNVQQYDEHDPVEMAIEKRDDVPGGCIIYGRWKENWHCNVSARSLVRLLLDRQEWKS